MLLLNIVDKIEIAEATLLSETEAREWLTQDERMYKNRWWLRTQGNWVNYAQCVFRIGQIDKDGTFVSFQNICVRPALKINITDPCVSKGDTFRFGGYEFKIINSELAWMYKDDIGPYLFRYDSGADDANDYEVSDVKKYIEEWLKKTVLETTGEINYVKTN